MNPIPYLLLSISFGGLLLAGTVAYADMPVHEAQETARLLAVLLDSGREVVKRNQELIDNPRKGNKGFTPDVFERQLVEEFYYRSGVDLTSKSSTALSTKTRELLHAFVQAGKAVVSDAQPVINQRGVGSIPMSRAAVRLPRLLLGNHQGVPVFSKCETSHRAERAISLVAHYVRSLVGP